MILLQKRLRQHLASVALCDYGNESIDNLMPAPHLQVQLLCKEPLQFLCMALQFLYKPTYPKGAIYLNQRAL